MRRVRPASFDGGVANVASLDWSKARSKVASWAGRSDCATKSEPLAGPRAKYFANTIKSGTSGGMPAFSLPEDQLSPLADYVHSLNATAFESKPAGVAAAGERFFFGEGNCAACHMVAGRGGSNGPDLSAIPNPNALTAARRGPPTADSHGRASVLR